jgi:hypothetical protein
VRTCVQVLGWATISNRSGLFNLVVLTNRDTTVPQVLAVLKLFLNIHGIGLHTFYDELAAHLRTS